MSAKILVIQFIFFVFSPLPTLSLSPLLPSSFHPFNLSFPPSSLFPSSPLLFPLPPLAHIIFSLRLMPLSHPALKYFLWVFFPLILILFSVTFVQVVSIHAIGQTSLKKFCASNFFYGHTKIYLFM